MTLLEYLDTVDADYSVPDFVPLVWTTDDVTKEELESAAGNPYARILEFGIEVRNAYQDAVVLSRVTQVTLFQAALPDQRGVPKDKMQAVWDQVFMAPAFVDECLYGDEDFIRLQYLSGFPPSHDTTSGGLASSIRFRLWFARRTS